MKRNLIVYASKTGNTEMVANEMAKHFETHGWTNDMKKLPDDYDTKNPDFQWVTDILNPFGDWSKGFFYDTYHFGVTRSIGL